MSSPEDPFTLLAVLKERYGIVEQVPPFGPAVIVPNSEYQSGWTRLLNQAGFKAFCGEEAGRVAWIIPLKTRPNKPGPNPGQGCITGRPWTSQEDEQLLAVLNQDKSAMEIASLLAPRLSRTERAVKSRVLKLRRRQAVDSGPTPPGGAGLKAALAEEARQQQQAETPQIRSLLESALLLVEAPEHKPALRVILQACLRLAEQDPRE